MAFKRFYLFKLAIKKIEGYGYKIYPELYMRTSNAAQAWEYAERHFKKFQPWKSNVDPNCLMLVEK